MNKAGIGERWNVWPVAQRELREGARRPVNHRLRFLSAGVGTLLLWLVTANSHQTAAQLGGWLFASLHTLLLGLILLIVPALTADCIAREKREGTLGLLFLTPLSAGGIVAGKALVQGLRALTLWLAVLPILCIPFTTGGVTWFDAFSALSLEFCATVLCLAAGLLASSMAKERNTAFILGFSFGACFLLCLSHLVLLILAGMWRGSAFFMEAGWWKFHWDECSIFCGLLDTQGFGGWNSLIRVSARLRQIWMWLCLTNPPLVLLFFYVVARLAAWQIERSWQDKIPSPRRESLIRRYCTPLFHRRFRRKMQRTLDWNPIAWLQQYSWKARLSKWGLCLAFALIGCAPRHLSQDEVEIIATALLLTLAAIYTFVGVSGFLEEKRSGALELLLVTPISVNKLIFGRVWGLWKQFLPAGLVLAAFYMCWANETLISALLVILTVASGFLALPFFVTYSALRVKNLILAAVLTWIAMFVAYLFAGAFLGLTELDQVHPIFFVAICFVSYAAFALLTCFLLRHSLSRRIYSF
jgi:ABC-type Na+ efflux pump permease subunit